LAAHIGQLGTARGHFIAYVIGPHIIAAAYQFTQNRLGSFAAAEQLESFIAQFGFVGYQFLKFLEFAFIAN
jgi:hypothetical protein